MQVEAAESLRISLEEYDRSLGIWNGTGETIPAEQLGSEEDWRAALADVLGLPEGLVEGWLRGQRDADRVLVRGDRVEIYDPVPKLSRIEIGDRVKYLYNNWGQIINGQAVEAIREHAARYDMPVQGRAEGSVENIRRAMVEIPAPRRQARLHVRGLRR